MPAEVLGLDRCGVDEYLDTGIAHLTNVGSGVAVHVGWNGHGIVVEQIDGLLGIDINRTAQAIVEHCPIDTYVELLGLLPLEVRIGVLANLERLCPRAIGVAMPAVGVVVVHGERKVGRRWNDTRHAVTGTELEVVEPGEALHPRFVDDVPAERCRWEVTPLVVGTELRAAFTTDGEHHVVAVVVTIAETSEEADEGVVALVGAHRGGMILVGEEGTLAEAVVEIT